MPQSEGYIAMGWALMGSPKFRIQGTNLRAFAKYESLLVNQQYRDELKAIALVYGKEVAAAFNRAHGRTGKTAKSVSIDYRGTPPGADIGGLPTQVVGVKFVENIGAVVNPLPAHRIQVKEKRFLSNWKTAPYKVETPRTKNFYYEFPFGEGAPGTAARLKSVEWYQGGDDSHSPDRTWFEEGQARDVLEGLAVAKIGALARYSTVLWSKQYSGFELLAEGKEKFFRM